MHQNTYLTIVNNDQGSPNAYHWSRRNLDPQPHSTGTMRATTKSKAMKMGISTEKIDHLTHMAPNLFLSLIPSELTMLYLNPLFHSPFLLYRLLLSPYQHFPATMPLFNSPEPIVNSDQYYLPGGDLYILVQDTMFQVH